MKSHSFSVFSLLRELAVSKRVGTDCMASYTRSVLQERSCRPTQRGFRPPASVPRGRGVLGTKLDP